MTTVTTIDGRQVDSCSEAWRATCEAVHILNMPHSKRGAHMTMVEKMRGAAGRKALEDEIYSIEPAYLLAMGSVYVRRAYLAQAENYDGLSRRQSLESRIVALWEQRKAAKAAEGGV